MSPEQRLGLIKGLHAREGGLLARTELFDLLTADVTWEVLGSPEILPWAGRFDGREAVRRWMALLDEHMEYQEFDPLEFFGDGETVFEVVHAAGRARATGKPFSSEVVRIWTFRGSKVARVRSYYDTGAYERALRSSKGAY